MKKLKFRVWDKKNNRFIDDVDFCIYRGNPIQVYTHVGDGYCQKDLATTSNGTGEFIEDDWIIQQYINVNDKNNEEIYEGDIIKFINLNYEVYWDKYKWNATCPNYSKYHWPTFNNEFMINCYNGIVIGNSLENPELLK